MEINLVAEKAKEVAEKYNPEGLSPFPYEHITSDKSDLKIIFDDSMPSEFSGATIYDKDADKFSIFINKNKSETRQHFTMAHELGHYFLHSDVLKLEKIIIDKDEYLDNNNALFRIDIAKSTRMEIEANNFAAILIMPEKLVKEAWKTINSIEECAKIFKVSAVAMSIRLQKLGLIGK